MWYTTARFFCSTKHWSRFCLGRPRVKGRVEESTSAVQGVILVRECNIDGVTEQVLGATDLPLLLVQSPLQANESPKRDGEGKEQAVMFFSSLPQSRQGERVFIGHFGRRCFFYRYKSSLCSVSL